MFVNYLKIAFRNLFTQKIYTFINIFGLAVGMLCCILIYVYVSDELSYDNFHKDGDRIFRVISEGQSDTDKRSSAAVSGPVAPTLKSDFPQVEYAARIFPIGREKVSHEESVFYEEDGLFADNDIFQILTFTPVMGDLSTALERPSTIVISQDMSARFFKADNPIGQKLNINNHDFEITGVIKKPAKNTHLKYNFILSIKTLEGAYPLDHWFLSNFYTYVKLAPNVDVSEFSRQIHNFSEKHVKEAYGDDTEIEFFFLQPVRDIHLKSHLLSELEPPGNPMMLYLFSMISVLILLIACMNFMNLATSRAVKRAREVGIRKIAGATRSQLIWQFLIESFIISIFALLFAVILVDFSFGIFNSLTDKNFSGLIIFQPKIIVLMVALTVFVGFAAGSYPAYFLSIFKPSKIIKGTASSNIEGVFLRKLLVVGQFTISIILIIGSIAVFQQINFMKHYNLGFDINQKLVIDAGDVRFSADNVESIKEEFTQYSAVTGATLSSQIPGQRLSCWTTGFPNSEEKDLIAMNYLYFDSDFIPEYNIKLVAGRNFFPKADTEVQNEIILNETAVKALGWNTPEEAINQIIAAGYDEKEVTIIGVVSDFNYHGLQQNIEPLALQNRFRSFNKLTLNVNISNLSETLEQLQTKWKELFPAIPFRYSFLDNTFAKQYQSEERLGKIVNAFMLSSPFESNCRSWAGIIIWICLYV
ncbi:MAG: ABC transporter permease [Candidatus Marinimicrobia bacterium]|nr:ABC transporter permease [Candidatus Neomarinimicrobiota bacterium]